MSEGRRRRSAKQARRDAKRSKVREPDTPEESSLVDEVRQALAGHPLDLLGMVSMLIESTVPDPLAWLPNRPQRETVDLDRLLDGLIGTPIPETSALLAVLAEFLEDADLRQRCRHEVAARDDELPDWLADLAHVDVFRAARMTHVLGDNDEVLLGAALAGGDELTCVAFIDHNQLSAVKDAFPVPDSVDNVIRIAAENNTDPDITFVEMSLADARAWIDHGLQQHAVFMDQTDTWPACRPLLRWLIRHLPEGGAKYRAPMSDGASLETLCDDFFASASGAPFSQRLHGDMLLGLLSDGDPVRWSVPRVRRALRDSWYDEFSTPVEVAIDAPELLKSFIPFAHAQSGIREALTAEALAAVDAAAPAYREAVWRDTEEEFD
ncbi:hypothetical protein [Mycobacterium sp. PS03-16]|uniref:hypothetical protein n=1 Tax=Mycobacterium sp. PS03-16 TaxID=2559611 RepID=UPI001ADDE579|nr:hypothetical protein [Mycobacterium sp. PS03-16]